MNGTGEFYSRININFLWFYLAAVGCSCLSAYEIQPSSKSACLFSPPFPFGLLIYVKCSSARIRLIWWSLAR